MGPDETDSSAPVPTDAASGGAAENELPVPIEAGERLGATPPGRSPENGS
jgi:hypothetical protein